jgi:hypothetical protein
MDLTELVDVVGLEIPGIPAADTSVFESVLLRVSLETV